MEKIEYKIRLPVPMAIWMLAIICTVTSIGGIVLATLYKSVDGGWGGAAAVAVTFLYLFSDTREKKAWTPVEGDTLELRVARLESAFDVLQTHHRSDDIFQKRSNFFYGYSSILGTLTWAFGDVIADIVRKAF